MTLLQIPRGDEATGRGISERESKRWPKKATKQIDFWTHNTSGALVIIDHIDLLIF